MSQLEPGLKDVPVAPLAAGPEAPRAVRPRDWLMLLLALFSIGLLSWETWGTVSASQRTWILGADYAVCAIFAAEFLWEWRLAGWQRGYLLRNWYEILGMIPVSSPALRGFRLFRVIRILILLSRFGMAADRALGRGFTYRLVNRLSERLVNLISARITLAVLDEVCEVLQKGHYTKNVARALDENREALRAMALEKVLADPQMRRFQRIPFFNDISNAAVEASLRVATELLHDPRTDEFVADVLRENIQQIRVAVAANHPEQRLPPTPGS